jgi:3,4-dihydroxy 2-butanone 4-phosphate synthase/GTP cyclohydrolase II
MRISEPVAAPPEEVHDAPLRVFGHDLLASVFTLDGAHAVCLHIGKLDGREPLLLRIHSACLPGEVLGSDRCDCAAQLRSAVERIAAARRGLIVYVPQHDGRGAGLVTLLRSLELMDEGLTSAEAFARLGVPFDSRDYATAIYALTRLDVTDVVVITDNNRKVAALESAGVRVHGRIPAAPDYEGS